MVAALTHRLIFHHGGYLANEYTGNKVTCAHERLELDKFSYLDLLSYAKDIGCENVKMLYFKVFRMDNYVLVYDDNSLFHIVHQHADLPNLHFFVVEDITTHFEEEPAARNEAMAVFESGNMGASGSGSVVEMETANVAKNVEVNLADLDGLPEENEDEMDDEFGQDTFDNVCVDVSIMTDDEEDDELQAARQNVTKANADETTNGGEEEQLADDNIVVEDLDESDDVYSASDEMGSETGSVYYDSDEMGSLYSESDKECADDALRKPTDRVRYDPDTTCPIFGVGMIFKNVEECRHALAKYAIVKRVSVRFVKNDRLRVRAKCAAGCPWVFLASKDPKEENYIVKTYNNRHQCHIVNENPMATSKFLAKHLMPRLMAHPHMKLKEIRTLCRVELKLKVSHTMCQNIKTWVHKDLATLYKDEYASLHDYLTEIRTSNPGTTCMVKATKEDNADGVNHFVRLYICFEACKRGWLEGCRRIIGLDGCFLKGMCKGQLLCAIGRDGNNQMFPLAWAVVSVENKYNWSWFLRCLKYDLPLYEGAGYTIISDMQKGLDSAIKEQLPEIEHRMCARHVYAAWAKKWKGEERKLAFWTCAKSTFEKELRLNLKVLTEMGEGIVEDMLAYEIDTFCKAYFKCDVKCDVVDNNLSETFNGWILEARCKPIISMLEDIRTQVMTRLHVKKKFCKTWINNIAPRALAKFEKNESGSHLWEVLWNGDEGDNGHEITSIYDSNVRHNVFLNRKTCTCREWDLTGIPCQHAIAAIYGVGGKPQEWIDSWYTEETYLKAYNYMMQPVRGKILWEESGLEAIAPPPYRKMPGRPRKSRRRQPGEPRVGKLSRVGRIMTCKICKEPGHNVRGCPKKDDNAAGVTKQNEKASASKGKRRVTRQTEKDSTSKARPSKELLKEFCRPRKRKRPAKTTKHVGNPSTTNPTPPEQPCSQPLSGCEPQSTPPDNTTPAAAKDKGKKKETIPYQRRGYRTPYFKKPTMGMGTLINADSGVGVLDPGTNRQSPLYGPYQSLRPQCKGKAAMTAADLEKQAHTRKASLMAIEKLKLAPPSNWTRKDN